MKEKQIKTIRKICKILAERYKFGYMDREDIEQEGFIIGMEALPFYDEKKSSLETFLYIHISNKLKTFKRDNYLRKDFSCKYCGRKDPNCEHCQKREWKYLIKKHLMEPLDIEHVNGNRNSNMYEDFDILSYLEKKEILKIINENLDVPLRSDYLKIIDGMYLPKQKRDIIENRIRKILQEHGYID
jgi:DNA-directed RNA polymerase specialized sigma24 family protein